MRTGFPGWKRSAMALGILGAAAVVVAGPLEQAGLPRGKVLFENERVVVVEGTIEPGETTGMHKHPLPAVIVCVESATLKESLPDGRSTTYERKAGDVRWREKDVQHDESNIGQTRLRVIAVQLKP